VAKQSRRFVNERSWRQLVTLAVIIMVACMSVVGIEATANATTASASEVFPTMNDSGGIYWRSSPNWASPEAVAGNGFYPGTEVTVYCYQAGSTVPGSADYMWVEASWASGPGRGSGWMNEHFVNDGAPIDQAAPGIPACSPGGAGGGGSAPQVFGTMNDSGGIYWRSSPEWSAAVGIEGNGFYPGTNVAVYCYQAGSTVPGSWDHMWVDAEWASGPGRGSGWMNEHFVNDGAPIDQAATGIPACDGHNGPPGSGAGAGGGGGASGSSPQSGAIAWARQWLRQPKDPGWCLLFVFQAYQAVGIGIGGAPTAAAYWNEDPHHYQEHPKDLQPPVGALVFWGPSRWSSAGHVGIYEGNDTVISTSSWPESGNDVHQWSFSQRNAAGYPYDGWLMP